MISQTYWSLVSDSAIQWYYSRGKYDYCSNCNIWPSVLPSCTRLVEQKFLPYVLQFCYPNPRRLVWSNKETVRPTNFCVKEKSFECFFFFFWLQRGLELVRSTHSYTPMSLTNWPIVMGQLVVWILKVKFCKGISAFLFFCFLLLPFFFFFVMGRIYTRPIWHSYSILHWYCTRLHSIICGYVFKKERVKTV